MKKILTILKAILPGLMLTAITFIVSQAVQLVVTFKYVATTGVSDQQELIDYLTEYLQGDRLLVIVIVAQAISALIAALIIIKGMKKPETFRNASYAVRNLNGVSIVIMMVALELTISFLLMIISLASPGALDNYSSLISQSGLGGLTVISTIATIVAAPIGEEIIFRGLTVRILEKTEWNFWIVNFIQAALFGIYHLNFVQGLYAFVLGFILGIIGHKCRTIWANILGHAVFNFAGTYVITFVSQFIPEKMSASVITFVIALAVAAAGMFLLLKKAVAPAPVGEAAYEIAEV